jgi:2-iminobutanoate/2-iminopropanoate deaminase
MTIIRKNFEELGLPVGPYTHVVEHESTLHTSGFTAFGTNAQNSSGGEQAHAVMDQLEIIARHYGKSLADLVKVTVFITNPAVIPEIRDALTERYGAHVPASSMVMVSGLFAPELKVEIEGLFGL